MLFVKMFVYFFKTNRNIYFFDTDGWTFKCDAVHAREVTLVPSAKSLGIRGIKPSRVELWLK